MRADQLSSDGDTSASINGDVAEFEARPSSGKIIELRRAMNGSYGASLSYYPETMIYYVALFQQNKFRHVFETQNDMRAEAVYSDLSKSTVMPADSEIRRIKLEAETAFADR